MKWDLGVCLGEPVVNETPALQGVDVEDAVRTCRMATCGIPGFLEVVDMPSACP